MYRDFLPLRRIGVLSPLAVNDNAPYEFYRLAPPRVMMVVTPVGLKDFSAADVERVFEPVEQLVDMLKEREVDIVIQSGVPLPILIGVEAHDRLMDRIAKRAGTPVTSTITAVIRATQALGLKNIAVANKWDQDMNACMAEFFGRGGINILGAATEPMRPAQFQGMGATNAADLAYTLGRQALETHPDCDGLYIGGGAWMVQPVVEQLEQEFGKPCICNQGCMIWDALHLVDYWKPAEGHGRLYQTD